MDRKRLECGRADLLDQLALGVVLAALILIADDRHFRLAVGVAQQQPVHAIRLDRDISFQILSPERRKIIGPVDAGGGVELRADPLQVLLDAVSLRVAEILAALEHHVLKNMRRARGAGHLVA